LQIELDEASQALATKREQRVALLRKRESAIAEHRRRAETAERQLQDLRPAQFHKLVSGTQRADALTEREIVSGLSRSADAIRSLIGRASASSEEASKRRRAELDSQMESVDKQIHVTLQKHTKLELARLQAAGAAVAETVVGLLDVANARAELVAMGLDPDEEGLYTLGSMPHRRDMRRLRRALMAAKAAWEEATTLWGEDTQGTVGNSSSSSSSNEGMSVVWAALESTRARIAGSLAQLQRADPGLYELAMLEVGEDAEEVADEMVVSDPAARHLSSASQLPHGWEAHSTPEGHVYYHNLVTNETQWDVPEADAAVSAGWRLFQAESGHWFYHNPYDGSGIWWPELPQYPAAPESLQVLRQDLQ